MQKKIYVPAVAAIIAVSAILAGTTYSNYYYNNNNYDPFDDPAYSHNVIIDDGQEDDQDLYLGNKTIAKSSASYPMYTLYQIIDLADIIAIGTVTDREYVEVPHVLGNITAYSVYTRFTLAVEEQFKGPITRELLFTSSGGETENVKFIVDGLRIDRGDRVLLFLGELDLYENMTSYTAITSSGEYKILNNTQVAKHGESVTVPLEDFVDLIQKGLESDKCNSG